MKSFYRFVTVVLLSLFVVVGIPGVHGQAQALEIKFGHVGAPGSLFDVCAKEFAKRANAKLGAKATVQAFGSSQLGNDREMLRKLKLGTITFALPSTVMSSVVDVFGLFEMPFLVKDRDHMRKIRDQVMVPKMMPAVEKQGYQILAVWENGFRHITNSKRPINVPEDLKDLKLRTPKGAWRVKMFKTYGANPTPMAFSEVFVALQTGVIDGQENPYAQIYPAKFYEVQKYLSITGHVYTPAYVTTGKSAFAKLPADVQQVLKDVAVEMQEFVYATAEKMEDDLLKKLKARMQVNTADKKAFIAASGSIYEEFGKQVPGGADLVKAAQSFAD
ncbi:MAG: TRAP transporter substrate-binding protein [Thermodesulfobacteriota bacterium]